jgi:hypothetical protein
VLEVIGSPPLTVAYALSPLSEEGMTDITDSAATRH